MIETYDQEISELIKRLSPLSYNSGDFTRLCWLIGNMQGQLDSFKIKEDKTNKLKELDKI